MFGRSRSEPCGSCGNRILVPPLSSTFYCHSCQTTTRLQSSHDRIRRFRGWLRGMFSNAVFGSGSQMQSSSIDYRQWEIGDRVGSAMNWPASFPANRAKKRAVLVGVSYSLKSYQLKGTVNDVKCMRYFLCEKFQFTDDSILVLTEEERDPRRIPTKENIRAAIRWLVWGNRHGDSLVFHFSGHGSQKLDLSGDEVDGYAETLCPVDYEEQGVILDDELNATLVRPLCTGVKLHAIIDSCHSGTVLDLPYLCRMSRGGFFQWEDHTPKSGTFKGTSGGLAICISGCDDNQSAQDTQALSGSAITGAMVYSLIYAVETDPGTTYGRMLSNMRSVIRGADSFIGFNGPLASFVKRVLSYGIKQDPQLSASEIFDIYRKPFLL
ncbi:metacaspase-1-like [Phalaenopsis equestris]|uniref:metacaspase-1-like n=1 Tax=Phalaenopsis equestris TaxID=78828 RepID=UPI0009E4C741|nr:metacaspase-1-like [Phalaenopsis equestris]